MGPKSGLGSMKKILDLAGHELLVAFSGPARSQWLYRLHYPGTVELIMPGSGLPAVFTNKLRLAGTHVQSKHQKCQQVNRTESCATDHQNLVSLAPRSYIIWRYKVGSHLPLVESRRATPRRTGYCQLGNSL